MCDASARCVAHCFTMKHYQHLGIFSDLVDAANKQQPLYPLARPGRDTQQRVREVMGFCNQPDVPLNARVDATWEKDGLIGEAISWSVGYGPRTAGMVVQTSRYTRAIARCAGLARPRRVQVFWQRENCRWARCAATQSCRAYRDGLLRQPRLRERTGARRICRAGARYVFVGQPQMAAG